MEIRLLTNIQRARLLELSQTLPCCLCYPQPEKSREVGIVGGAILRSPSPRLRGSRGAEGLQSPEVAEDLKCLCCGEEGGLSS